MSVISLIRHGQASFGQANYDALSPLGQQQAEHLGQHLRTRGIGFDAVYCGNMQRHRQTAAGCLAAMGKNLPVAILDGLNEYDHDAVLIAHRPDFADKNALHDFLQQQDHPHRAFQQLYAQAVQQWIHSDGQGYPECWQTFQTRTRHALAELLAHTTHCKHVAVFSSGGPITAMVQPLLDLPDHAVFRMNDLMPNASITKLLRTHQGLVVSSINEHSAFDGRFSSLLSYR